MALYPSYTFFGFLHLDTINITPRIITLKTSLFIDYQDYAYVADPTKNQNF